MSVEQSSYTVFNHQRRIATGELVQIASQVQHVMTTDPQAQILAFADDTGIQTDVNWFDVPKPLEPSAVAQVSEAEPPRKAGRPKLGVVAREITLLPRHWEWLNQQSGGASVALRKLVEDARRANEGKDRIKRAQEATYRVMTAMAGNEVGFEEALRALYAGNQVQFKQIVQAWPVDIQTYLNQLAVNVFAG
ncbi:DUF2239 family protein [Aquirhabdus parva]|uniref:DUF2239 family protein n=1 Tax=Aquirhabdus parva TaxID=2283318 RepID=A0A345PAE5_9GAMM|nr:DUF2239 family protein [Aquirhabdus parva]AXI04254.1 DUF2239 family protein [Aquirhabdus parva]